MNVPLGLMPHMGYTHVEPMVQASSLPAGGGRACSVTAGGHTYHKEISDVHERQEDDTSVFIYL